MTQWQRIKRRRALRGWPHPSPWVSIGYLSKRKALALSRGEIGSFDGWVFVKHHDT